MRQAMAAAQRQRAASLELRAAVDLVRLPAGEKRAAEAREELARVYGGFREGFETADLIEAKRLIEA